MNYWLLKSEPDVWSLDNQMRAGAKGIAWDGVRNYQAANNLKAMKYGDLCFFYHSNIGKEIVGTVKVIKEAFLDKSDKTRKFVSIKIKALYTLKCQVSLYEIKKNKLFRDFSLVKQSRLSVMSVDLKYWKKICKMGKV